MILPIKYRLTVLMSSFICIKFRNQLYKCLDHIDTSMCLSIVLKKVHFLFSFNN